MKKLGKLVSIFLALVTLFCAFAVPVSAAASDTVASSVSVKLPLVTSAMPISGASRVYSYSDSSLSTQITGYYIDTYIDQIVVTAISGNGKAVYVTYPSSSASSGFRSRWFAAEDILGIETVNIQTYTASANSTTYRLSSSSNVTSFGSIAANDECVCLGSRTVEGKTYYPTIYPISSAAYNKVSGVKYKLALATSAPAAGTNAASNSRTKNAGSENKTTITSVRNDRTTVTKTVTIQADSLESWCKQIKLAEMGLTGFGKLVGNANSTWVEGDIITGRQVLMYKQIKVFVPKNVYTQGPGLTGGKYVTVNVPYKIKYTIHSHEYETKVDSQYWGNLLVGLVSQQIVHTQTCSCGKTVLSTWSMPDLTFENTSAGKTYTITSQVSGK